MPDDKKPKDVKGPLKPDPDTLHKTDPQDNMEGPVSSIMQNLTEEAEGDTELKKKDKAKKDQDS